MKYMVTAISMLLLVPASAQKVHHGIGVSPSVSIDKATVFPFLSFSYTPKINLYEKPDFSVSAAIPASAGLIPGSYLAAFQGYLLSIPAVVNFNWGAGSTMTANKGTGYFIGAGGGYIYKSLEPFDTNLFEPVGPSPYLAYLPKISGLAVTCNMGIRTAFGRRRKRYQEFRFSYTLPFQRYTPNYGFHFLITNNY